MTGLDELQVSSIASLVCSWESIAASDIDLREPMEQSKASWSACPQCSRPNHGNVRCRKLSITTGSIDKYPRPLDADDEVAVLGVGNPGEMLAASAASSALLLGLLLGLRGFVGDLDAVTP